MSVFERRRQDRVVLEPPGLGVLRLIGAVGNSTETTIFVDVLNQTPDGALIEAGGVLSGAESCLLQFYDRQVDAWRVRTCRRAWEMGPSDEGRQWGLVFERTDGEGEEEMLPVLPEDIDFLLRIRLLDSVPRSGIRRLFNCLGRETFSQGERLLVQGEAGDRLYVIQEGACRVEVEKDGTAHPIAELRRGDVLGEMSVLTGEPRTASAVALADVTAWRLNCGDFEALAAEQPGLLVFLTELVANRFECSQVTADRTVAKYVISKKLGKGEWSIVYQGEHRDLGMPVAVKMMRHDLAMLPEFLETFRHEASVIASLRHPNIVQVFDIENAYRTMFIVMERLDGFSLKEILERSGRLSARRTAVILAQICAGLAYAHSRGVVHRDIKPANIVVQEGDRIKILDFGVACGPDNGVPDIPGTPLYAAPEGAFACECTPRVDMYSVGLMAYEMVVGERPFVASTRKELARQHRTREIPDPAVKVPDLPGSLREFILTCCRRDSNERYVDMGEAGAALAPLCGSDILCGGRRMTALYLFYPEESQAGVRELMEEISLRAGALGVELRSSEIKDV